MLFIIYYYFYLFFIIYFLLAMAFTSATTDIVVNWKKNIIQHYLHLCLCNAL